MFQRGLAEMMAGRYATACPALAESLRLDHSPGTLFTLAECEAKAGRVATALYHYREFLALVAELPAPRRARQREREEIARAQREALLPRVPTLGLHLPKNAPPDLIVRRDGAVVPAAELGRAVPVNPGVRRVRVEDREGRFAEVDVPLLEGERREIRVPLPARAGDAGASAGPTQRLTLLHAVESPVEARARARQRQLGLGLAAGGLALGAAGAVSYWIARAKVGDIEATGNANQPFNPGNDDFRAYEVAGYTMLVAGAGVLAGGAVLYFWGRRPPAPARALTLVPIAGSGGAGLTAAGVF